MLTIAWKVSRWNQGLHHDGDGKEPKKWKRVDKEACDKLREKSFTLYGKLSQPEQINYEFEWELTRLARW